MKTRPGRDGRAVMLMIGSGGGGLFALLAATSAIAYAVFSRWFARPDMPTSDRLPVALVASSITVVAVILLIAAFQAVQTLRGQADPAVSAAPLGVGAACLLAIIWLASSITAQLLLEREVWKWSAPLLHLIAIAAPIYMLLRIALGGIQGGSRLRLWGTVASSLVLGTGLAALVEAGFLIMGVLVGGIYVLASPGLLTQAKSFAVQLSQAAGTEEMLTLIEPLLLSPVALALVLVAVAFVAPVVEEAAKSAVAWVIFDRLSTPAQGFWCGALSGGGFALLEGLMASSEPTASWAVILLIRGASSLMHIVASAVVGWGIASFRMGGNRLAHLLGGYAAGIGAHTMWNAAIVALAYGGLRLMSRPGEGDVIGLTIAAAGGLTLVLMLLLLPLTLTLGNRALRSTPSEPETLSPLREPDAGDEEI